MSGELPDVPDDTHPSATKECEGECDEDVVRPIAVPYVTSDDPPVPPFDHGDQDGWFLVCPFCHYVFERLDADAYAP